MKNQGAIALIVCFLLSSFMGILFIIQDAQREEKIRPVQVAVQVREIDPNVGK